MLKSAGIKHLGMLKITDNKIIFLYDNGEKIEIKFEEIESIAY